MKHWSTSCQKTLQRECDWLGLRLDMVAWGGTWIFFSMKFITPPTFVFSTPLNKIWWRCTALFLFGPLGFLWCNFIYQLWNDNVEDFLELSLLNLKVTIHSYIMFNLMHFGNYNISTWAVQLEIINITSHTLQV